MRMVTLFSKEGHKEKPGMAPMEQASHLWHLVQAPGQSVASTSTSFESFSGAGLSSVSRPSSASIFSIWSKLKEVEVEAPPIFSSTGLQLSGSTAELVSGLNLLFVSPAFLSNLIKRHFNVWIALPVVTLCDRQYDSNRSQRLLNGYPKLRSSSVGAGVHWLNVP
mmetsp:Transcript_20409/g.56348  ORF Transcript_20409/g.56348 Transcript_20409/m.56348 type:complete len:165 (-) Transcript_20409:1496-1990(-)